MSGQKPVEGYIQKVEIRNGRARLSELYYRGCVDNGGKLRLTACAGRSRPLDTTDQSIRSVFRRAA